MSQIISDPNKQMKSNIYQNHLSIAQASFLGDGTCFESDSIIRLIQLTVIPQSGAHCTYRFLEQILSTKFVVVTDDVIRDGVPLVSETKN